MENKTQDKSSKRKHEDGTEGSPNKKLCVDSELVSQNKSNIVEQNPKSASDSKQQPKISITIKLPIKENQYEIASSSKVSDGPGIPPIKIKLASEIASSSIVNDGPGIPPIKIKLASQSVLSPAKLDKKSSEISEHSNHPIVPYESESSSELSDSSSAEKNESPIMETDSPENNVEVPQEDIIDKDGTSNIMKDSKNDNVSVCEKPAEKSSNEIEQGNSDSACNFEMESINKGKEKLTVDSKLPQVDGNNFKVNTTAKQTEELIKKLPTTCSKKKELHLHNVESDPAIVVEKSTSKLDQKESEGGCTDESLKVVSNNEKEITADNFKNRKETVDTINENKTVDTINENILVEKEKDTLENVTKLKESISDTSGETMTDETVAKEVEKMSTDENDEDSSGHSSKENIIDGTEKLKLKDDCGESLENSNLNETKKAIDGTEKVSTSNCQNIISNVKNEVKEQKNKNTAFEEEEKNINNVNLKETSKDSLGVCKPESSAKESVIPDSLLNKKKPEKTDDLSKGCDSFIEKSKVCVKKDASKSVNVECKTTVDDKSVTEVKNTSKNELDGEKSYNLETTSTEKLEVKKEEPKTGVILGDPKSSAILEDSKSSTILKDPKSSTILEDPKSRVDGTQSHNVDSMASNIKLPEKEFSKSLESSEDKLSDSNKANESTSASKNENSTLKQPEDKNLLEINAKSNEFKEKPVEEFKTGSVLPTELKKGEFAVENWLKNKLTEFTSKKEESGETRDGNELLLSNKTDSTDIIVSHGCGEIDSISEIFFDSSENSPALSTPLESCQASAASSPKPFDSSLLGEDSSVVSDLKTSVSLKRGKKSKARRKKGATKPIVVDEETRMDANSNNISALLQDEDSQSSTGTNSKREGSRRFRCEVVVPESTEAFTADKVIEYVWPLEGLGEHYYIQEHISQYLGIMSFKRRYPDLRRRPIESQEREYLRDNGIVTEIACDLGITAVRSEDVMDVMFNDYPSKYEEVMKVLRDKKEKKLKEDGKVDYQVVNLDKSKMQEYSKKAAEDAARWNHQFNKERRDERRYFFDLQSFTMHNQASRAKKLPPEATKIGSYPLAVLPGQYTDYYRNYSPAELKMLPFQSVLTGPFTADELNGETQQDSDDEDMSTGMITPEDKDLVDGSSHADPLSAEKQPRCKVCNGGRDRNKIGKFEPLIICASCRSASHPTCINLTLPIVHKIEQYAWQCMDCKRCAQCNDPDDEDKMIFCDLCDRGYHIFCCGLRKVPNGRWHCKECNYCSSCGARNPSGFDFNLKHAEWQHEFRKGKSKKELKYVCTLCVQCDKYWKRRQFCHICLKVYKSIPESGMVRCMGCPKYAHKDGCSDMHENERFCNICLKSRRRRTLNHNRIIAAAKKKMASGF